jgi:hypothetical protein
VLCKFESPVASSCVTVPCFPSHSRPGPLSAVGGKGCNVQYQPLCSRKDTQMKTLGALLVVSVCL